MHGVAISSSFLEVVLLVDKGYLLADTKKPTGESVFSKVQQVGELLNHGNWL